MGFFGSTPKITPPPPEPTLEDPEVEDAARKQRLAAARAKSLQNTILTGSQGVTSAAPTQTKGLLGA